MRIFKTFIFFTVIFIAQTAVFARLDVFGGHLDALLSSLIVWGLYFGAGDGFMTGAFAGFLTDLFTLASRIVFLPAMAITGIVSGLLRQSINKETKGAIALSVFLVSIFSYILSAYIMLWFYSRETNNFLLPLIISSLLNALFSPIAALAAEKIGGER